MIKKITTIIMMLAILLVGITAVSAVGPNFTPECTGDNAIIQVDEKSNAISCVDENLEELKITNITFDTNIINVTNSSDEIWTKEIQVKGLSIGSTELNVTVSDGKENISKIITVTVGPKFTPECTGDNVIIQVGDSSEAISCVDENLEELKITNITFDTNIINVTNSSDEIWTKEIQVKGLSIGSTELNVTVSDGKENISKIITVTVGPKFTPECTGSNITIEAGNTQEVISCTDENLEKLEITNITFDTNIISVTNSSDEIWTKDFSVEGNTEGSTMLNITVTDSRDNVSHVINITVVENRPQTNGSINDTEVYVGESIIVENVSQYFFDNNNATLLYTVTNTGRINTSYNSTTDNLTITGVNVTSKGSQVTITATDGENNATQSFIVTVPNRAPVLNISDRSIQTNQILTLNLSTVSIDADGHNLSYVLVNNTDNTTAICSYNETITTLTCNPVSTGTTNITINVTDGFNQTNDSFILTVTAVPPTPTTGGGGGGSGNIGTVRIIENEPENETTEPEVVEEEPETNTGSTNTTTSGNTETNTGTQTNTGSDDLLTGQATGPNDGNNARTLAIIAAIILAIALIAGLFVFFKQK